MTTQSITVQHSGFTLSQLIWRTYQRQPNGFIEKVYDLNPGLAADVTLPVGRVVIMPVSEMEEAAAASQVIRLWD